MTAQAPNTLTEELTEKQVRLLRETYRVIGTKGMHRMTLQDVADGAGVSKAVLIYYFATKENLVLRTMRWVLAQVAERIAASVKTADTPAQKVEAMIDAIFVDARRNRNFYLAVTDLVANAARNNRFSELSATFRSIENAQYAEVVSSFGVADPAEAAAAVRAIIDGLFLQWLEEDDWKAAHAEYKALAARTVLAYLGVR
jgi:TetR/AcrR family transcriptional regulator, fatty acid metabolism regulator protein